MFKNMGDIMKQAQEMQSKMKELQDQLGDRHVEGSAGGGMVRVIMNGRSEVLRVHIDPSILSDVEMLEDLVASAVRDAQTKSAELVQKEMGGLAGPLGNLGLPGLG